MGTRTISQTINLSIPGDTALNKYITDIDTQNGIIIHAINNQGVNFTKLNTEGLEIVQNGISIAQFGNIVRIGNKDSFHVEINSEELGFWKGENTPDKQFNKIAYLSGEQLYITKSVVLEQMNIGKTEADSGKGQWSWKIHQNADGKNNLYLKWIG